MINNTAFICYSHSEYSDIWGMFFGQLNKYFPDVKKYLFTDKVTKSLSSNINIITYDNSLSYSHRVAYCLEQVKEEICLFHHEDMVLYNNPDIKKLNELCHFLLEYDVGYIKLLKGGKFQDTRLPDISFKQLYYLNKDEYMLTFAIQPTLWKTSNLHKVYKNSSPTNIEGIAAAGNFELQGSQYLNGTSIIGLYWYDNETKRGSHHYNSSVYPHGNFVSKGKWVYSEYNNELIELHKKYNIDKNIRGTV